MPTTAKTPAQKKKLASAYRICSKIQGKTKKEHCVYKVYNRLKKSKR